MHERWGKRLIGLASFLALFLLPGPVAAQHNITTDGSLGQARILNGPKYAITPDLGKQVGGNLFQSFGMFGLAQGETAKFSGPSSVTNIIGRVTGGSQSSINGAVNSSIQGASLYLINPSGIVFGPNASVNISGSLHVSTADYVRFSDGVRFYSIWRRKHADDSGAGGVRLHNCIPVGNHDQWEASSASPPARASASPAGRSRSPPRRPSPLLPAGSMLPASAPAARCQSCTRPGSDQKSPRTARSRLTNRLLNISDPTGNNSGGAVRIRAGTLTITSSDINADNFGPGPGGRIALRSDGGLTLGGGLTSGGAVIHTDAQGAGPGGDISLVASTLTMGNAVIRSQAFGAMDGGNISVNIAGAASVDATSKDTGFFTQTGALSTGSAGNIRFTTGPLSLVGQGTGALGPEPIASVTAGSGNAGAVVVAASASTGWRESNRQQYGRKRHSGSGRGHGRSPVCSADSGTQIRSITQASGNAGNVVINAGSATIANVAEINSGTTGSGNGGSVRVVVNGSLNIIGPPSDNPFLTGISSVADPGSTGSGGSVMVSAGSLSIAGYAAEISSSTLGKGDAGGVGVQVAGPLSITGPLGKFPTGVIAATLNSPPFAATGSAGSVAVTAQSISLTGGGSIASTTAGTGDGGSVMWRRPVRWCSTGWGSRTQIAASATGSLARRGWRGDGRRQRNLTVAGRRADRQLRPRGRARAAMSV